MILDNVLTMSNSSTLLKNRDLRQFKYFFLLPLSKVIFKDKTVTEHTLKSEQYLKCMVIDNNSIIRLAIERNNIKYKSHCLNEFHQQFK